MGLRYNHTVGCTEYMSTKHIRFIKKKKKDILRQGSDWEVLMCSLLCGWLSMNGAQSTKVLVVNGNVALHLEE